VKIGAVSKETGLGIHTIRYYEKQGLIKTLIKDVSGHRIYNLKDVELLNWINCMKKSGMPLSRIQEYSKAFYGGNINTCLTLLQDHLQHLDKQQQDLRHYIDVTEDKISSIKSLT
jgi:DNA-binding transcriptional MerR regulator